MSKENILVPTKEEVKKMLEYALNSGSIPYENMGELLGMKFVDSLLPNIKIEPKWGYEGLAEFYKLYGIDETDTIKGALDKLK